MDGYRRFHHSRLIGLLGLGIAFTQSAAFGQESISPEYMRLFDEARTQLQTSLSTQPCSGVELGSGGVCDFAAMCSKMAAHADSADLYVNEKGEKVPNFALFSQEKRLARCFMKAQELAIDPQARARAQRDANKAYIQKLKQSNQALNDSIAKNGDEIAFSKIDSLIRQEMYEKAAQTGSFQQSDDEVSPEQARAELLELERKTGVTLSRQTREAWTQFKVLQRQSPDTVPGPGEWKALQENPFLDLSLLVSAKAAGGEDRLRANQELYRKEAERSFAIFKRTQADLMKVLESRRTAGNSAQIDTLKARLSTVRMRFLLPDAKANRDRLSVSEECPGPNAFYHPGDHSFNLCPQIMQLPEEALRMTIAHELGHSVDSCNPSDPLVIVEGKRRSSGNGSDHDSGDAKGSREEELLSQLRKSLPHEKGSGDDLRVAGFGQLNEVGLHQSYSEYKTRVLAPPVPLNQHPLRETIRCLAGADSVGARLATEKSAAADLDRMLASLKEAGANPSNSSEYASTLAARRDLARFVSERGGCMAVPSEGGHTQSQEAMGDWMATQVLGSDVLSEPSVEKRRQLLIESRSYLLAEDCPGIARKVEESVDRVRKSGACGPELAQDNSTLNSITDAKSYLQDAHPLTATRINRGFLSYPGLRPALGCPAKPEVKSCE